MRRGRSSAGRSLMAWISPASVADVMVHSLPGPCHGSRLPAVRRPICRSAEAMMQTNIRLIDVSHAVEHGMVTYRGLPAPVVCDYLSREASRQLYAPGVEFHIGKVEMVANTGTYL